MRRLIRNIRTSLSRCWIPIVVVISALLMITGPLLMLNAVIDVRNEVTRLHKEASDTKKETMANDKVLLENSNLNRKQWELLEKHNPELAVPQVVEDNPAPSPAQPPEHIVIREKQQTKLAAPTPTPIVKTRTIVKYKKMSKQKTKPWYEFFRSDHRDPKSLR